MVEIVEIELTEEEKEKTIEELKFVLTLMYEKRLEKRE